MWNLLSEVMYPNDTAIEYLRTFIHQRRRFHDLPHTIGYRGLDKRVNKLADEMGVEIFGRKQADSSSPYSAIDNKGNLFPQFHSKSMTLPELQIRTVQIIGIAHQKFK
ncbi:hypothetical protein [Ruminiclostridium josui]|uniref:hypothetical protein n=1 Tax=Ruminiclostridium josui TaxID=1499 RepID=UPI0009E75835|nr:hypothetical protein [Ruminiclostridium josui]